jgi:copper chaperone CopZ
MKFIKSFVLAFTVLTAKTNIAFSQTTTTKQTTDSLTNATVKVKGITCSMDLKMISANVEKVNGVSSCKTGKQGTTTTFEVKYNPALVTEKEIFAAIENTGSCENPKERPYKVKQ